MAETMGEGAGRRQARQFEPPPWERDQFEELEKRRAGDEAAPAKTAEQVSGTPPSTDAREPEAKGGEASRAEKPELDQVQLDTMMFELKATEPPAGKAVWQIGMTVAVFVGVLGTVLMLWGMTGLVRVSRTPLDEERKRTGYLLAGALLTLGVGAICLAAWFGYKAYGKRGER